MRIITICLLISLITPFNAAAQQNFYSINTIAEKLNQKFRDASKETFLIQTSKNIYQEGETIWFTIFVTDSLTGKLIKKSKNLYVDLVTDQDSAVKQLLLRGDRYMADGSMDLNDSTLHGWYWLRAYTQKTIDERPEGMSVYPVYILNGKYPREIAVPVAGKKTRKATGKPTFEIFPEGGHLISGASSVFAIRAKDANGNPLMTSGFVRDPWNDTVARFTTNRSGLALAAFSPFPHRKYFLYTLNGKAADSIGALPPVNMYAAQVAVTSQSDESIHTRILLEDSLYKKDYKTFLICVNKDSICFAGIGEGNYELNIPIKGFPGGETNILLYSSELQLLSVRKIYIPDRNATITVHPDKQNYAARENVSLDIAVTDFSGKPLIAAMSAAVLDSKIADSNHYLYKNDLPAFSAEEQDLTMLSSTSDPEIWNIQQSPAGKQLKNYLHDSLSLSGVLFNKKHEPVKDRPVILLSRDIAAYVLQDTTDARGRFSFLLPDFTDSTEFHLQVNNSRGRDEKFILELDPFHFPVIATPAMLKENYIALMTRVAGTIKNDRNSYLGISGKGWLKPVTVRKNISADKTKIYSGYVITKEMLNGSYNNVVDAVLKSGKFHLLNGFLVTGGPNKQVFDSNEEPIVIMDGQQIPLPGADIGSSSPVLSYLSGLQVQGIDHINLLNESESGMYGVRGARGAIEIFSTTSPLKENSASGLIYVHPQGYHVAAPFVMPDYGNRKNKNVKNPDERLFIYWDGNLITDKNGKAAIHFYSSDGPATYIVNITGVTAKGDRLSATYSISRN